MQEGQNAPFSHYLFIIIIIIIYFFGGGGRGSKLSIMIANLEKNRIEQPPSPQPPENKDELRKSHKCDLFGGDGGS